MNHHLAIIIPALLILALLVGLIMALVTDEEEKRLVELSRAAHRLHLLQREWR